MSDISFEALYDADAERSLGVLLLWLEDFFEGLGGSQLLIDKEKATAFVTQLAKCREQGFPANGGFDAASPFKKAALIYVYIHQIDLNPFMLTLKDDYAVFGDPTKTASVVGFALVQACLDGAEIIKDGVPTTLKHRIDISDHFMNDLIEASKNIGPEEHFKVFSLLFESLAYQRNDSLPYDLRYDQTIEEFQRPQWY